jgi:hypothetical protein
MDTSGLHWFTSPWNQVAYFCHFTNYSEFRTEKGIAALRAKEYQLSSYVTQLEAVCKSMKLNAILMYSKIVHPHVLDSLTGLSVLVITGQSLLNMNSMSEFSKAGLVQNVLHLKEGHVGIVVTNVY